MNDNRKTLCVVPTFIRSDDDLAMTVNTLKGLSRTIPEDQDIMIVDDSSPYMPGHYELHRLRWEADELPQLRHMNMKTENLGFANSVNYGLRYALEHGMHCLLVNADIEFHQPSWFDNMVNTEGGLIGAKLLYPTGLIQHAGVYYSVMTRTFDHLHKFGPADLPAANFKRRCPVTGALQLIKYATIEQVGLYDEVNFRMGWEDIDYNLRVFEAGLDCVYNPAVSAIHHESAFRGQRNEKLDSWMQQSFHMLYRKHAGLNFGKYVPMLIGQEPLAGAIP